MLEGCSLIWSTFPMSPEATNSHDTFEMHFFVADKKTEQGIN